MGGWKRWQRLERTLIVFGLIGLLVGLAQILAGEEKTTFRRREWTPHTRYYGKINGFPTHQVRCVISDGKTGVVAGTYDQGILQIDSQAGSFRHLLSSEDIARLGPVNALTLAPDGQTLHIAANNGLFQVRLHTGSATLQRSKDLADTIVLSLALTPPSGLWAGTTKGLFDPGLTRFLDADGLVSNQITALAVDGQKRPWIGTDRGLQYKQGTTLYGVEVASEPFDAWVNHMAIGRTGSGLLPLERRIAIVQGMLSKVHLRPAVDPEFALSSLALSGKGTEEHAGRAVEKLLEETLKVLETTGETKERLIVGSDQGCFAFDVATAKGEVLNASWTTTVAADENGGVYFATQMGNILPASRASHAFQAFNLGRRVKTIIQDLIEQERDAVVPPGATGLLTADELADVRTLNPDDFQEWLNQYVQTHPIRSMCFDRKNCLWIAIEGVGLFRIDMAIVTADLFASAIVRERKYSGGNRWAYLLRSQITPPPADSSEVVAGLAAVNNIMGGDQGIGGTPKRIWVGHASQLLPADWHRLAPMLGAYANPGSLQQFLEFMHNDPLIFIPAITLEDARKEFNLKKLPTNIDQLTQEQIEEIESLPFMTPSELGGLPNQTPSGTVTPKMPKSPTPTPDGKGKEPSGK